MDWRISGLLMLALLAPGCESRPKSLDAPPDEDTTTVPVSTTLLTAAEDKARAQRVVLTVKDVGSAYRVDQVTREQEQLAFSKAQHCAKGNPLLLDMQRERGAYSLFRRDQFTSIQSDANFWANEAEVDQGWEIVSHDDYLKCAGEALAAIVKGDAPQVSVTHRQTERKPVVVLDSDEALAFQTWLSVAVRNQRLELFVDYVLMRKGRGVVSLSALSTTQPFAKSEFNRLVALLDLRLGQVS